MNVQKSEQLFIPNFRPQMNIEKKEKQGSCLKLKMCVKFVLSIKVYKIVTDIEPSDAIEW